MTKRRIITIILTLLLCFLTVLIHIASKKQWVTFNPLFIEWMMMSTAAFVFFGCMLQSFGHPRISMILGDIVFVVLCICVFYSKAMSDIIMFIICMFIVLQRTATACECVKQCEVNK